MPKALIVEGHSNYSHWLGLNSRVQASQSQNSDRRSERETARYCHQSPCSKVLNLKVQTSEGTICIPVMDESGLSMAGRRLKGCGSRPGTTGLRYQRSWMEECQNKMRKKMKR